MEFSIIKNKDVTKGEEMSNKREKKKWSTKKKVVATLVSIVALFLIIVLGYVAYVFGTYHRIPDKQKLSINKPASSQNANSSETSESKNVKTLDTSKLTKNKEYICDFEMDAKVDGIIGAVLKSLKTRQWEKVLD